MADILQLTAPPGLANYLRPGRTGAATLLRLIAQNQPPCNGVVLDPTLWTMQANLAAAARASGIETVLDPRSLELASAGGREKSGVSALPWAGVDVHTAESLSEASERRNVVAPLAEFAVEREFSAVLAPTHFISSENDEWLAVDDRLVADLRGELDSAGGRAVALYRPLFIHSRLIRPSGAIERIATRLRSRSVDAIWLGVHPFGTASSGSLSLRWYVDACRALHPLGVPLVGIHTGTVGLLLLAIGALGGIESGMTDGEHFNADQFTRAPEPRSDDDDGPRSSLPRVYIPSLGIFLTTREADIFFAHKGMPAQHGCQLPCCPRGVRDMIRSRLPHFALSRMEEVRRIERVPLSLRPQDFLDHYLRQGSDKALAAEKASPRAATARTRFDEWRLTFGGLLDRDGHSMPSFSPSPTGQRLTHAASASHQMALRTSGIARRLEEISDRTGVKDVEVAQLLGTTPQSINRWRRSAVEPQTAHVHRILELTYVAELLSELYEPEDARLWLFSRHRLLDDRRPVDLIAAGDTESVLRVLSQLRDSAYVQKRGGFDVVYDEALLLALEQVGWTEFRQTVWRRVFMGRPPLAENVDGARWNPPGVSALYTSLTEATAIHEHEHLIDMQGKPPKLAPTMYQVEVNVKRCLRVESEALTALGVDFSNPDSSACRAACERIGGAAAHVGAEALLVPSVREPDQWNLVLFTANVDLTAGSYYDLVSLGE